MPRFLGVQDRVKQRLHTTDGRRFHGYIWTSQLRNLPDASFVEPRRYLRVREPVVVRTTDVIRTPAGVHYLLADHGTEEFKGEITAQVFRLFVVNKQMVWTRPNGAVDPVARIAKPTAATNLGTIWLALEPVRLQEDQVKIPRQLYRVITGAAVAVGDKLDAVLTVQSVTDQLGIKIAEVA